ncbi:MAG: hypothetical protein NTV51_10925 [Verrucomicrobia bacterium]|nr:hypothetical protein [Verrucomicrobiota bacterium]
MQFSISSSKAFYWSVIKFEQAMGGPKITHFDDRTFGPVSHIFVHLELQNPKKTLKNRTRYFDADRSWELHVVLGDELGAPEEKKDFEAIKTALIAAFQKASTRMKRVGFQYDAFERELVAYLDKGIAAYE